MYTNHTSDIPFVGRHEELKVLSDIVTNANNSHSTVVFVEGTSGIGKTSFLNNFLSSLKHHVVINVKIFEEDRDNSRSVVENLVSQLSFEFESLARNLQPLSKFKDTISIGKALLECVDALQVHGNILLVLDDIQWCDPVSGHSLSYFVKRLFHDRVTIIASLRNDLLSKLPDGWHSIRSDPKTVKINLNELTLADISELIRLFFKKPMPTDLAASIKKQTGGHPLYVALMLEEIGEDILKEKSHLLPIPQEIRHLLSIKMSKVSQSSLSVMQATAILGTCATFENVIRLSGCSRIEDSVIELRKHSVLYEISSFNDRRIEFMHPIIRSAALDMIPLPKKREMYLEASQIVDENYQLNFRALGQDGANPQLASELELAAYISAESRNYVKACSQLKLAAKLSNNKADYERRVELSVFMALLGMDVGSAASARQDLESFSPSAWRSYLLGSLNFGLGRLKEAELLLSEAWGRCLSSENIGQLKCLIAITFGMLYLAVFDTEKTRHWYKEAFAESNGDRELQMAASELYLIANAISEDTSSDSILEQGLRLDIISDDEVKSIKYFYADNYEGAKQKFQLVLSISHRATYQAYLTVMASRCEYRLGNFHEAIALASLALDIAESSGQISEYVDAYCALGMAYSAIGFFDKAKIFIDLSIDYANSAGFEAKLASALEAKTAYLLASENLNDINYTLFQTFNWIPSNLSYLNKPGFDVEIMLYLGYEDDARLRLKTYFDLLDDNVWAYISFKRLELELNAVSLTRETIQETTENLVREANSIGAKFEVAQVQKTAGKALLKLGDTEGGIRYLKNAVARYEKLRATPYAQSTNLILMNLITSSNDLTMGETSYVSKLETESKTYINLTTKEALVANLVASGKSNSDISNILFISTKTVEYHIAKLFTKFEVENRTQLALEITKRSR